MIVGVPRENYPGERRVALVPAVIPNLKKAGLEVLVQAGAGLRRGIPMRNMRRKGRKLAASRGRSLRCEPTSSCSFYRMARTIRREKKTCRCSAMGKCLIGFLRPLGAMRDHPGNCRTAE